MPVVHLRINVDLNQEQKKKLLLSTSRLVAETMDKPIADVMVIYSRDELVMGAEPGPAAFVDLKCISGLSLTVSKTLCEGFYRLLNDVTGIKAVRIYVNFFEVDRAHAWRFKNDMAVCAAQSPIEKIVGVLS